MNYLTSLLFGAALGAIVAVLLPIPEPPMTIYSYTMVNGDTAAFVVGPWYVENNR